MNSNSAYLLWLPRDQWCRRYKIHKNSIKFWTLPVILILKTIICCCFFTQNTPAYDNVPSKFGCKQISSSADMVETVISDQMSHHCDPELEDRKPAILRDILAHDVASPYQVWLQKVQQQGRYHSDKHSLEFWTFSVTLTLTTIEQSNLFMRQSILWWCAMKPSLLAKGSVVQIIYLKVMFWLYYS